MTKLQWKFTLEEQEIILSLIHQEGMCDKCYLAKKLCILSEKKIVIYGIRSWDSKKFCWSCTLINLQQLEESNCEITNKQTIINELRCELNNHE